MGIEVLRLALLAACILVAVAWTWHDTKRVSPTATSAIWGLLVFGLAAWLTVDATSRDSRVDMGWTIVAGLGVAFVAVALGLARRARP